MLINNVPKVEKWQFLGLNCRTREAFFIACSFWLPTGCHLTKSRFEIYTDHLKTIDNILPSDPGNTIKKAGR